MSKFTSQIKSGLNGAKEFTLTWIFFFSLLLVYVSWDSLTAMAQVIAYVLAVIIGVPLLVFIVLGSSLGYGFVSRQMIFFKRDKSMAIIEIERQAMQLNAEQRLVNATIKQVEAGMIHPQVLGEGKFSSFPAAIVKDATRELIPEGEDVSMPLLPAISHLDNLLIVGGKGTGKTTLLQWIESERVKQGEVIVLDSHTKPGQWQGKVVGAKRNYEHIKHAMIGLNDLLDKRYNKYSDGFDNFTPLHQFIDEFTLLPDNLKKLGYNIQEYSISQLTEGRKVGLNCLWGIHSDKVKAMGLKGASDIKECFDAIVYLKRVDNKRYALVDFGEGKSEIKYSHPGPFYPHGNAANNYVQPPKLLTSTKPVVTNKAATEETKIIEAVERVKEIHGKVIFSKVTKLLNWTASGPNNEIIRGVLIKNNIEF